MAKKQSLEEIAYKYYLYLIDNIGHKSYCFCPACLYYKEYVYLKSKKGRRYGKRLFFFEWLFYAIKYEYLLKTNRFEVARYGDRSIKAFHKQNSCETQDLDRAKKILNYIYDRTGNDKIQDNIGCLVFYYQRTNNARFIKLVEECRLRREIKLSMKQRHKRIRWEMFQKSFADAQKVGNFIKSFRGVAISQRKILNHFSKMDAGWLKTLRPILILNYNIEITKMRKTILYLYDEEKLLKRAKKSRRALRKV